MRKINPNTNPALDRDTQILQGTLTHADRQKIAKAWARAGKLGLLQVMAIDARRADKRGFQS